MVKSFSVVTVENGFIVNVHQGDEIGSKEFVFDSPAKLKKGIKFFVEQLTQKGE